jgi:hypothetical protein
MGLIKKFDSFVSEKLVAESPVSKTISKPVVEPEVSDEAAAQQVIDRFSRIYNELPTDEKKEIDKYFQ